MRPYLFLIGPGASSHRSGREEGLIVLGNAKLSSVITMRLGSMWG